MVALDNNDGPPKKNLMPSRICRIHQKYSYQRPKQMKRETNVDLLLAPSLD